MYTATLSRTGLGMAQGSCSTVLMLVDDEPLFLDALRRFVPKEMGCVVASSVHAALEILASTPSLHGLAVDVTLPDGSGLDILEVWVKEHVHAPTLVMTGASSNAVIANRACLQNSRFLAKPFGKAEFDTFTSDVMLARWPVPRAIAREFSVYVLDNDLSAAQADLLAKYVSRVPRRELAEALEISENTLKTRVRQLCAKLGVASLEEAYEAMRRG